MQTSIDFATNHPLKKLADAQENMPPEFQEVVNKRFMDMIDDSTKARDKGMKRALDHADAVNDGWSEKAYSFAKWYVSDLKPGDEVTGEDIRLDSYGKGIPKAPNDGQSWGGIMRKLAIEGYVYHAGWTRCKSPDGHLRPVTLWKKK